MGMPITTDDSGICFAFPNVCLTPTPSGDVPIPYPSIGQLSDAKDTSEDVLAGGAKVVTTASIIENTSGDEAGTSGGVKSGTNGKEVTFPQGSSSVFANSNAVIRMFDTTEQNSTNAVGTVLGGNPTVLVGG
ncbi:MAG: DUF4150 domain-containing protein [Chloroflexi bacterium]|nr:DUF4150 domain-containing protein [Chloroflexota bacterium]